MIIIGERKKYARLELRFDDKIDFIKVIRPDGKTDKISSFLYQPIDVSYDDEGYERITKSGQPIFVCRYTPDFSGDVEIEAYAGNIPKETVRLEILQSDLPGYVQISENNRKYFSYSNGASFFSIGVNTAFPICYGRNSEAEFAQGSTYGFLGLRQYERWFKKLSENGVNVARVWIGHEYFTPDTEQIYEFDYVQFTKIDMLLDMAKKYGLKLKLTLEQFRGFDYEREASSAGYDDDIFRKFNKKLYSGERRCETVKEWLTDDTWKNAWLAKVNEFAKRYSGDTEIFAIELWNEMNTLDGWEEVVEWNKEMLARVKELFAKNLVVNSLGSFDADYVKRYYETFCWDKSDFVQAHRYLDQGAPYEVCRSSLIDAVSNVFDEITADKPVFLAETGACNNRHSGPFKYYLCDDDGIIFADAVYTPVFCKSCGTGNIWHWDERYIEAKNLYGMYKPIKALTEGIEFDKEDFERIDLSDADTYCFLLKGKTTAIGYIRNKAYNWENVLRDLKNVEPVKEFAFKTDFVKAVKCFSIWDNEQAAVCVKDDTITFSDIAMGCLFKIEF